MNTSTKTAARASRPVLMSSGSYARAIAGMNWREIIRFLRQRNRVVGCNRPPLLFWLLFGAGMNQSFQVSNQRFSEYFVPGIVVLILLFTAIFATISIIEDRNEGFLQSIWSRPSAGWTFVLGKVLGGSILAVGQALLFLALALSFGSRQASQVYCELLLMIAAAIGLTCLGFCLCMAFEFDTRISRHHDALIDAHVAFVRGFFPGAEYNECEYWRTCVALDHVCEPGDLHRRRTSPASGRGRRTGCHQLRREASFGCQSLTVCWCVTLLFAVGMFVLATRIANRTTKGDLR